MRLSKFIKTTGLALSFVNLVPSHGDEQIVWLWEVDKAKQLAEKGKSFMYYIQDIYTLMDLLESPAKYVGGTCKVSETCMSSVLDNDTFAINVMNTIESNKMGLVKVEKFTNTLKKIISQKVNGQSYVGSPDWNEVVMPCGTFYRVAKSGDVISVDPVREENGTKKTAFMALLALGSEKVSYVSDDRLMFHESDPATYNPSIRDFLARLSEAKETDDVSTILYGRGYFEAELESLTPSEFEAIVRKQPIRREKSQPSSTVPSRNASPGSEE